MAHSIDRQNVLPWSQVLRISFNALRARLFRSMITTSALVLAVAFLAYTFAVYVILEGLWPSADEAFRQRILSAGYVPTNGHFGSNAKDRWLVVLSLLVCTVGIVNAQLMAVTERFREIGTLKCLGALDSFVIKLFVLEAAYQGLIGGCAGSLLGGITAVVTLALRLGPLVIVHPPLGAMAFLMLKSVALAVVLSLVGVMYPAWVAARMEPAMALRSEP
ncbi:FtsX-like permease family protein [Desulfosoma caldarium]|uniref:FtsX-like permease family protein n=2 Tax=Desulfosoma caldarium TaxID=610254 RepID=A0A3N1UQQ3_9BACT|nr:FtsX-like permease family protein [Desulfosoma caldarium]